MSKTLVAFLALIVGLVVGAFGALTVGGGAMMGVGAATGLSTGICSTVKAAQEEGLMTAEQVDQVLDRAARDLSASEQLPEGEAVVGSAAACEEFLARLHEGK